MTDPYRWIDPWEEISPVYAGLLGADCVVVSKRDIQLAWLGMANVNATEEMWAAAERLIAALADGAAERARMGIPG